MSGWDDLELTDTPERQKAKGELARRAKEVDELMHRAFKQNPDGAKALAHMQQAVLYANKEASCADADLRQWNGKRELVLEIMGCIKRVEDGAHDS